MVFVCLRSSQRLHRIVDHLKRPSSLVLLEGKGSCAVSRVSVLCVHSGEVYSFQSQFVQLRNIMSNQQKQASSCVKLLSQKEAQQVDDKLMNEDEHGFSVDQLMEQAGMSVAHVVFDVYPLSKFKNVLCVVGSGNNGGDALVAARHICHYGYKVTVLVLKEPKKQLYKNLILQCKNLGVEIRESLKENEKLEENYDLVLDGLFGFSFTGDSIRSPYDKAMDKIKECKVPILSIDVPSGWHVEEGDKYNLGFDCDTLISLTTPKKCAKFLKPNTKHYIGGRFVPFKMEKELGFNLPKYSGKDIIVNVTGWEMKD